MGATQHIATFTTGQAARTHGADLAKPLPVKAHHHQPIELAQRITDLPKLRSNAPSTKLWEKKIQLAPPTAGKLYEGNAGQDYALPPSHHLPTAHHQKLIKTLNLLEGYNTPKQTLASLNQAPGQRKVLLTLGQGILDQTSTGAVNMPFNSKDPNSDFLVVLDKNLLSFESNKGLLSALHEQLLFADIDLNGRPFDVAERIRKNQKVDAFHREIGATDHYEETFALELRSAFIQDGTWTQARDRFALLWSPRVRTALLELRLGERITTLGNEYAWLQEAHSDLANPEKTHFYKTLSSALRTELEKMVELGIANPKEVAQSMRAEPFIEGADWKKFLDQLSQHPGKPLSDEQFKLQRQIYLNPNGRSL